MSSDEVFLILVLLPPFLVGLLRPLIGTGFLVISLLFLPAFPGPNDSLLPYGAFVGTSAALVMVWALRVMASGRGVLRSDPESIALVTLAGIFALNLFVAFAHEVPLSEWLRGAGPFIPLFLYLVLRRSGGVVGLHRLVDLLAVVGTYHAVRGIVLFVSSGWRITVLDWRFVAPLSAIAAVIWFANAMLHERRSVRVGSLFLFLIATVGNALTLTRGLVLAELVGIVVVLAWHFRSRRHFISRAQRASLIAVSAAVFLMIGWTVNPRSRALSVWAAERLVARQTVSVRVEEWAIAGREAIASPVLGKGLGFQYATSPVLSYRGGTSRYVHNSLLYFMLTTGIVGAGVYAFLFLWPVHALWRLRRVRLPPRAVAGASVVVMLFAYSLTSASFRLLQFNLAAVIALVSFSSYAAMAEGSASGASSSQ